MQDVEQKKIMKEGILQNKMVNSMVWGNIEKFNVEMKKHKKQMNNIENNLAIILNELSNI
jgi:hypothetical protein